MILKHQLKIVIVLVLGVVLGLIVGSTAIKANRAPLGYVPTFKVIGDVKEVVTIHNLDMFSIYEIDHKENRVESLSLEDIIRAANPISKDYEVLLVGMDGLMAKIDMVDDCYITFSDKNGWEFVNKKHPISSNIKMVKEIVVISKENNWEDGLNIISTTGNIRNITVGQMYLEGYTHYPRFEGTSTMENNNKEYITTVFTSRKINRIQNFVEVPEGAKILAVGSKGEYQYVDELGYLELKDNYINYLNDREKIVINDVKGLFINPPSTSIMDTHHDALRFLSDDERVLIIFIDGLGYHQYVEAINTGRAPFFESIQEAEKATAVYRSVTNAGFAAMITGEPPFINGVYSRDQREVNVPTIFGKAKELGKKAALIQGPLNILNIDIEPFLNIDRNNNGIADDEVFEKAMEEVAKGYDLMMVHFKSTDIYGHQYGDFHEETMKMIKMVDEYMEELVRAWGGKVIITSDHGMHSTEEGGSHGSFRIEDMIVPYLIIEGGKTNE